MRFAKPILFAIVAVLLATYVSDCDAMATPEQATQCCGSMPCSSHGRHGQDCCKTMPTMRAPFVKPATVDSVPFYVAVAELPALGRLLAVPRINRLTVAVSHAPPILSPPARSPLRI